MAMFLKVGLDVFRFDALSLAFAGDVLKDNPGIKALPTVYSIEVVDLFAHPARSTIWSDRLAADAIFK
jgi:hypothetical protein